MGNTRSNSPRRTSSPRQTLPPKTSLYTSVPAEDCVKEVIRNRVYENGYNSIAGSEAESIDEMVVEESGSMSSECCGQRVNRCCLGTIALQCIIILALFIALTVTHVKIIYRTKELQEKEELVCKTEECLTAAGDIIGNMNTDIDPCEDFYTYACGNFIEKQFLRPAESTVTYFRLLSEDNSKIIYKELSDLNKTSIFGESSTSLVKLKSLNKMCMDVNKLQKVGHKPLEDAMQEFGVWPIKTGEFNESSWNFTDQLARLHLYGLSPLFALSVNIDERNSSVNVLNLYQHGLTLSSEKAYNLTHNHTENKEKRDALVNYGVEVGRLLGADEAATRPVMEEIYELESKLAAIFMPSEYIRDPSKSYHKVSISDMQEIFGTNIELLKFINYVTDRSDFTPSYRLVTSTKPYFDHLNTVLNEYLQGDKKRIMSNYLSWYFIHRSVEYLGSDFQYAKLILTSVTAGVNSIDERWKVCTNSMNEVMGRVTGAIFIEGRFGKKDRDSVTDIVNRVRDTLIDNFHGYKWMDEQTANTAVKKARNITTRIGFPDYITKAKELDEYYEKFIVSESYFNTLLAYRRWSRRLTSAKLDKPPDPTEWQMTAGEVNAYYHPTHNNVVLPAGILRRPFYDINLPLAWNFGSMGSVIGHEISHGFDDQGSQFDVHGNLVNWWTNSSATGFSRVTQCFVDQYSKYDVAGTPLNGVLCLGENIADNGGVSISYKAYLQALEDTEQKPMQLPGLDLTDKQLFFLAFAQIWCMKSTPEYDQTSLNYNPHSPSKFRVQGTYSNNPAFAEAFSCKKGSPYNPSKRCKVW